MRTERTLWILETKNNSFLLLFLCLMIKINPLVKKSSFLGERSFYWGNPKQEMVNFPHLKRQGTQVVLIFRPIADTISLNHFIWMMLPMQFHIRHISEKFVFSPKQWNDLPVMPDSFVPYSSNTYSIQWPWVWVWDL